MHNLFPFEPVHCVLPLTYQKFLDGTCINQKSLNNFFCGTESLNVFWFFGFFFFSFIRLLVILLLRNLAHFRRFQII